MTARFKFPPLLLIFCLLVSCIEDEGKYEQIVTNEVTYLSVLQGFSFTSGEEVEVTAPIEFSEPFANEADIDGHFEISWFVDSELIATGYRIRHTFNKVGGFSLIFKTVNRKTGETYISDSYNVESKSAIGWGWMILSDFGDGKSSLSFISPASLYASYRLEELFGIEDGIGSGPKSLHYYYVLGSIPGNYVSGLPKIIVNQSSGTVSLDGRDLQKDKWMRDEFEGGREPEADFTMTGFAWKGNFYLICTAEGNVYVRTMPRDYDDIPYYGTYSSMPYAFEGGADIKYFNGFQNVTYWTSGEDSALMYDEANSRFIVFVRGGYGDEYAPRPVYLSYYDEEGEFGPGVPPVNSLGSGTRCIAAGAYEKVYTDPEYGGLTFYPRYVALLDMYGNGDYQVYTFTVNPMDRNSHMITENSITPFSGGGLMTENSLVKMSSNFEKNPFFYFTDGDRNLYVYSMSAGTHALAYTAPSRITQICASPIVCEFKNYGGNSESVNWRLALGQEDGTVSVVDVSNSKMVRLFEGASPDLGIKTLTGFGNIVDMVWATNYEGEY